MQPISGTTDECIRHFFEHARRESNALAQLAAFLGNPSPQTIRRWVNGVHPPAGEHRIRIRYFLAQRGYRLREFHELHPVVRNLGKLIVDNVVTFEEVIRCSGLRNRTQLYEFLHGHRRPQIALLEVLETFVASRRSPSSIAEKHMPEPTSILPDGETPPADVGSALTIRGTTMECFEHFAHRALRSWDLRRALQRATDGHTDTITEWITGRSFPRGEHLLRLRVFLTERGYVVRELENLPESVRSLAKLVAHSEITTKEIEGALGITRDAFLRYLQGTRRPLPPLEAAIQRLIEARIGSATVVSPEQSATAARETVPPPPSLNGFAEQMLLKFLEAIQPLADHFLHGGRDDRMRLRDRGRTLIYDVAMKLNCLCSEAMRNQSGEYPDERKEQA